MRTPFNPMSDAATEATRLAPAGRACSKFVWQSRFLENWAVRVLAYSGRPAFLTINNHPTGITDLRRPNVPHDWGNSIRNCQSGPSSNAGLLSPAVCSVRKFPFARDAVTDPLLLCRTGAGSNTAGWPRCCRDLASLLAAEMRRTGGRARIIAAALAGGGSLGSRGPEFVSEFETKQGQECAAGLMVRKYSVAVAGSAFEARPLR